MAGDGSAEGADGIGRQRGRMMRSGGGEGMMTGTMVVQVIQVVR